MKRYTFTFARHGSWQRRRSVYVTAQSSREAWSFFEALYPFKFFTCHGVSSR